VPLLVAAADDPPTLTLSLLILGSIVAIYLLSMWRLHTQMAAAKARLVAEARRLVAAAYAPIAADPTLASLDAHSGALGAARALEERAQSILTWPVDERTLRFIAVVVTGVVTSIVVRAVITAIGADG
jgi:hypothetical protein